MRVCADILLYVVQVETSCWEAAARSEMLLLRTRELVPLTAIDSLTHETHCSRDVSATIRCIPRGPLAFAKEGRKSLLSWPTAAVSPILKIDRMPFFNLVFDIYNYTVQQQGLCKQWLDWRERFRWCILSPWGSSFWSFVILIFYKLSFTYF